MQRKRARGGFWGICKKSVSWVLRSEEEGWLSLARGGLVAGATREWGADGKVLIERLCISLPYVETFNSKVIKGFVPELRSRYVFFVFRDSYVLCIFIMNILCTFHVSVFMYGYVTLIAEADKGVHTVTMSICQKINVIAWLKFKLAYFGTSPTL